MSGVDVDRLLSPFSFSFFSSRSCVYVFSLSLFLSLPHPSIGLDCPSFSLVPSFLLSSFPVLLLSTERVHMGGVWIHNNLLLNVIRSSILFPLTLIEWCTSTPRLLPSHPQCMFSSGTQFTCDEYRIRVCFALVMRPGHTNTEQGP